MLAGFKQLVCEMLAYMTTGLYNFSNWTKTWDKGSYTNNGDLRNIFGWSHDSYEREGKI
jgi:hypothetical protein